MLSANANETCSLRSVCVDHFFLIVVILQIEAVNEYYTLDLFL